MRFLEFSARSGRKQKNKQPRSDKKIVSKNFNDQLEQEQLDELSFLGSPCTKDCSGHRAGYEWSHRRGGQDAASWSPSFNKGAWLYKNGY